MRIALVCDEFYPDLGGIAHYAYELALQFVANQLDITVFTHHHPGQDEEEIIDGIPVRRIRGLVHCNSNRVISPLALRRCRNHIDAGHFDVVHGLTFYSPLAMASVHLANSIGTASVLTCHSIIERRYQQLLHLPFAPIYARTDRVIAVSDAVAGFCRAITIRPERIVTIRNGVDLKTFNPEVSGEALRNRLNLDSQPLVVTAIRLAKRKNPETLLSAFATVLRSFPAAHLLIAGAGREESRLAEQVRRLDIGHAVTMLGKLSKQEIAQLMRAGDVFVLPSRLEASPLAALEAAAAGTPVVCSRAGGVPEVFRHGEDALLFSPGCADSMAEAIVMLLADNDLRTRIGTTALNTARNLTWDVCATHTWQVYEEAFSHNSARRLHR